MATGELLSVVIPSWREGPRLLDAVKAARLCTGQAEFVVVAFEESTDLRDAARADDILWIDAPRACRGLQLKIGAQVARGRHLLFLHADSRLPVDAGRLVNDALATPGVSGGAFRLRFDHAHPVLDLLSWLSGMNLPASFLGDQSLFCTRDAYDAAGGFRPEPLFEDVDMATRLARVGRLVRLRQAVTTSARRFRGNGAFRQLATNALLFAAYSAGVNPRHLSAIYQPNQAEKQINRIEQRYSDPRNAPHHTSRSQRDTERHS